MGRKYLPFPSWPEQDQAAWWNAITEGDVIEGRGPAAHWALRTRETNIHHYSRWLGFLACTQVLDPNAIPCNRVTKENVRKFVMRLESEVAPRTVVSTLVGLKVMIKAMAPDESWRWLEHVCNALNRNAKPVVKYSRKLADTGELYARALEELDRLLATPLTRRIERVAYRDTLMLALLAARPLRLKNFSAVQIGIHLVGERGTWIIRIPGAEVKNKQPLEFELPESLIPLLETYLSRIRPSFGRTSASDALWLTFEGSPLDYHSIYCRFVLVTQRLFGFPINPHLLRDCAATSLSNESPAAALSAQALLGHRNFGTTERYYLRANQLDAARSILRALTGIRQK